MESKIFSFTASIPSKQEFANEFPHYKNYVENEGKAFFDLLMTPEALLAGIIATEMGFPAVAGIAERTFALSHQVGKDLSDTDKQFIGAVMRVLMEANGYKKTGKKKTIPHKSFTKGELYLK